MYATLMFCSFGTCYIIHVSYIIHSIHTGCFPKILKDSRLWPFSVFPRCQCVYTHQAGRTPALQQNWQFRKIKILRKKHNT